MTILRALAGAALLAAAVAGCSSSDSTDTPDPGALASSIAAQATSPAAGSDSGSGGQAVGNCADGQLSAKAALTATIATDVSLPDGCSSLAVTVPDDTDAGVGQALCGTAANEAFRYGIAKVVVVTDSGTELASGTAPSTECTATG
jgi:hypothetical protein